MGQQFGTGAAPNITAHLCCFLNFFFYLEYSFKSDNASFHTVLFRFKQILTMYALVISENVGKKQKI